MVTNMDESIDRLLIHAAICALDSQQEHTGNKKEKDKDKERGRERDGKAGFHESEGKRREGLHSFIEELCSVDSDNELARRELARARVRAAIKWVQPTLEVNDSHILSFTLSLSLYNFLFCFVFSSFFQKCSLPLFPFFFLLLSMYRCSNPDLFSRSSNW